MQLMPDTARDMAGELGLPFSEARLTEDAAYNKRLGSAYLEKMLARYDGHQALALAAYNAGPGKVDEWLVQIGDPRDGAIGTAAWVERIPYAETRNYTRNILRDLQALPASQAQQGGETLKPAGEPVALHRQRAVGGHLSVAFAQPIRIESKEPQS